MRNSGQSLIEVLVAFSAIIIVLGAITTIVISSLNQASSARNSSLSIQYAQEGLEQMKLVPLPATNGTYCLGSEDDEPQSGLCESANMYETDQFRRTVTVTRNGVDNPCGTLAQVRVEVAWTDSKCQGREFCNVTPLTTCLAE